MRAGDVTLAARINSALLQFDQSQRALPGIASSARRTSFTEQIVESVRRIEYLKRIQGREISNRRMDPFDPLFDPILAALVNKRTGNLEESFWLAFLSTHFGKNRRGGWRYARDTYGRLGTPPPWTWGLTSSDPRGFRKWLAAQQGILKRRNPPGGFGNHRKYESLDAKSESGTGAVIQSYVEWIAPPRTHQELVEGVVQHAGGDSKRAFAELYDSMKAVKRFGRTARFDYLSLIGNLGLAPIDAGSPYLKGSSGPLRGARLLFGSKASVSDLDSYVTKLGEELGVSMQVMEDALCNWQKSPEIFKPFRL